MSFMPVIEVFHHIMLQSVLSSGCSSLKNLFVTARRIPQSSLYTVAMNGTSVFDDIFHLHRNMYLPF